MDNLILTDKKDVTSIKTTVPRFLKRVLVCCVKNLYVSLTGTLYDSNHDSLENEFHIEMEFFFNVKICEVYSTGWYNVQCYLMVTWYISPKIKH